MKKVVYIIFMLVIYPLWIVVSYLIDVIFLLHKTLVRWVESNK